MASKKFITVARAQKMVASTIRAGKIISKNLEDADGHVLAEQVCASMHSPPFDQSAMDGFAFRFDDLILGSALELIATVKAGTSYHGRVQKGQAVRIFTGAPVPHGADTVVMQEKTVCRGNKVHVEDALLKQGGNIRKAGSQVRKGGSAVSAKTVLHAGSIGFLSSLGIVKVQVFRKPIIGIIVTGDELIAPGKKLKDGSIYESNGAMLRAALRKEGIEEPLIVHVKDRFADLQRAFQRMMKKCDVILFTGGISVGEYDFTGKVVETEGVEQVFYKVKQKPGKPLYFGKSGSKYVFGLPGNPASVLTCFYEYVLPAIRIFQNHPNPFLPVLRLPVKQEVRKKPGLTVFLKARASAAGVDLLAGQESYILQAFNNANAFIVFDELSSGCAQDTPVDVHLFGDLAR